MCVFVLLGFVFLACSSPNSIVDLSNKSYHIKKKNSNSIRFPTKLGLEILLEVGLISVVSID